MSLPPPIPSSGQSPPPPPGKAQGLVARSGFVLYEGGRSVFDESLTVYLSKPKVWPDADITDHVGRRLGVVKSQPRSRFRTHGPTAIFDPGGARVLHIAPSSSLFNFNYDFDVTGVSNGHYGGAIIGGKELLITANNERFGSILGSSYRRLRGSSLQVLDQDRDQVGEIRVFRASGSPFVHRDDYVMSIDPKVTGEFRRLLVAAPVIAAFVKRQQQSQS